MSPFPNFETTYALKREVAQDEPIATWQSLPKPQSSLQHQILIWKGAIAHALELMYEHFSTKRDNSVITLFHKPKKAVVAVAYRQLVLVPLTSKVTVFDVSDKNADRLLKQPEVSLGTLITAPAQRKFGLSAHTILPREYRKDVKDGEYVDTYVSPYWFVGTTADDRDANMRIKFVTVSEVVAGLADSAVDKLLFPIMENTIPLTVGMPLNIHVPKNSSTLCADNIKEDNAATKGGRKGGGKGVRAGKK